jgi:hypothetical protein
MNTKIISVTFETDVQEKNPQFSVPQNVCDILGVSPRAKPEDELHLVIWDMSRKELFNSVKALMSGAEVYGVDIRQAGIEPGQRIVVEARRK